ncbi:MAG: hypothetical protein NTY20_06180 [Candidatus Aenigmarchaeota archaeon]|nr:hypothetical protein [Candidatus Aenigmarchaeota archaeon]
MVTQKDISEYCPACRKYQDERYEAVKMLREGNYEGLGKSIILWGKMLAEAGHISEKIRDYADGIGLCIDCDNISLYNWDKIDRLHVQETFLHEFLKDRDERQVSKVLRILYSAENPEDLDFDDIVSLGEELEKIAGI